MPATALYSIELELQSFGEESCLRRCCAKFAFLSFVANLCCPMTRATYELVLGGQPTGRVEGALHFSVGVAPEKRATWRDDAQLQHTHQLLATLQCAISAEERV